MTTESLAGRMRRPSTVPQEWDSCYYITDAQFNVVAMIGTGLDPILYERVRYSAYGKATHCWPGDFNDDGQVNSTDEDMLDDLLKAGGGGAGRTSAIWNTM